MKKMFKAMVSAICAVTMLTGAVMPFSVSAEVITKVDNHSIDELSSSDFVQVISSEHLYYNTNYGNEKNLRSYIDVKSDEFKQFMKDAENRNDLITLRDVTAEEIDDSLKLIVINTLFRDNEENKVLINDTDTKIFAGYDDNGNPMTSMFDRAVVSEKPNEPVKLVQPGEPYSSILTGYHSGYVGVYNGRLIHAAGCTGLVKFDENGEPELVTFEPISEIKDFYKTIDVATGEKVLVKIPNHFVCTKLVTTETESSNGGLVSDRFEPTKEFAVGTTVIPKGHESESIRLFYKYKGDVTLDGSVDIRDVTKYARHIVKLDEIPSYADVISDLDNNGVVDVRELAMLKLYLIGEKDSL